MSFRVHIFCLTNTCMSLFVDWYLLHSKLIIFKKWNIYIYYNTSTCLGKKKFGQIVKIENVYHWQEILIDWLSIEGWYTWQLSFWWQFFFRQILNPDIFHFDCQSFCIQSQILNSNDSTVCFYVSFT